MCTQDNGILHEQAVCVNVSAQACGCRPPPALLKLELDDLILNADIVRIWVHDGQIACNCSGLKLQLFLVSAGRNDPSLHSLTAAQHDQ